MARRREFSFSFRPFTHATFFPSLRMHAHARMIEIRTALAPAFRDTSAAHARSRGIVCLASTCATQASILLASTAAWSCVSCPWSLLIIYTANLCNSEWYRRKYRSEHSAWKYDKLNEWKPRHRLGTEIEWVFVFLLYFKHLPKVISCTSTYFFRVHGQWFQYTCTNFTGRVPGFPCTRNGLSSIHNSL